MIEDISIKDFALIDSVSLEFSDGFTVFSGETGAGKSILIGALSFLLGGKASLDQIRTGTHEARVSGTLMIAPNQKDALTWLDEHGIEPENNRVLLRRIIRDTGKTAAWIGDMPVTRNDLAEFTSYFVDIHGQHEHQSLMKVSEHRRFLDSFAGIDSQVDSYCALYTEINKMRSELEEILQSDQNREQKIDILKFAVDEIESAKLQKDEDINLENEENRLSQFEKLYGEIETICSIMSAGDDANLLSMLKKIRASANNAANMDASLKKISDRIDSVYYEIDDLDAEISSYKQTLVFDPARLEEVQERSHLIYRLKQKYTSVSEGVQSLLDYAEKARTSLENLSSSDERRAALAAKIKESEKNLFDMAKKISAARKDAGKKMSALVEKILAELGMKGTQFSVDISEKDGTTIAEKCGSYGIDSIEFLISANVGSPLKSLAKIASGGELSRVMLALKTVLAESDNVDTLIFDEIDTGIGGEVSVAVGNHLKNLAKKKQILCITHLASIAVYADNQLKIEKKSIDGKTETHVKCVAGEERVSEIARMLSGDTDSSFSLEHARSLLKNHGGL